MPYFKPTVDFKMLQYISTSYLGNIKAYHFLKQTTLCVCVCVKYTQHALTRGLGACPKRFLKIRCNEFESSKMI